MTTSYRRARNTRLTVLGRALAVALGVSLLAAGCGSGTPTADSGGSSGGASTAPSGSIEASSPDTTAPVNGGTLTFAVANDPINLNPSGTGSGNDTWYVTRQIVDSLTEQDPATGEVIPWLAQSWQISDDAKSFTFTLRPGVTFSDGTPLTAAVVKANFDDIQAAGAKSSAIAALTGYQGTTVVDDATFTVVFSTPNAAFLQATSQVGLGPVALSTLAIPYDDRAGGQGVIGTGPFTVDHYTKNTEVVLNKRAGYDWGPKDRQHTGEAYLDQVTFKIVPEPGVRTGSLQSGQLQVIGGVAPQDIERLSGAGQELVIRPNPGVTFGLTGNESRPLVSDPAVRQAIGLAVNPQDVVDTALNENFKVATSVLGENTPGWVDLSADLVHDPEQAKSVLDAAGWTVGADGIRQKDGQRLHLVVAWIGNFGPNQTALELIQQQLKDVGIEIELVTGTVPDILAGQKDGKYDLTWGNLSRADGDVLRVQYSTKATNYAKIDDPALEEALQAQQATADPAKRAAFQATAQKILIDKYYVIPVHELTTVLGTAPAVHGVVLGADSRLSQLTDAFVTTQ